jgi:hypothetical protein
MSFSGSGSFYLAKKKSKGQLLKLGVNKIIKETLLLTLFVIARRKI